MTRFANLCRFLQRLVEGLRIQREQTLQKSASFKDGLYEGLLSSQIIPHFSAVFQGQWSPTFHCLEFPKSAKPFSVTYPLGVRLFLVGRFCLGHVARLLPWQAQKSQVMKGDAFDSGMSITGN